MTVSKQGPKKRLQNASVLVRMKQVELDYITEAASKKSKDLSDQVPGMQIGVGPFLRGGALRWAKEILGLSIEEFDK